MRIAPEQLRLAPAIATAFPASRAAGVARLADVDPVAYARTRNHLRGAVTRLSPYLTHGLLSTPDVVAAVGDAGKLAQELAWREFFQLVHAREALAPRVAAAHRGGAAVVQRLLAGGRAAPAVSFGRGGNGSADRRPRAAEGATRAGTVPEANGRHPCLTRRRSRSSRCAAW
jgi:hypothetical protein